jgi:hypothetical protein
MILPKIRDPRFITVRRGGTLQDDGHHLLAMWAADCAQHVLHHFEQVRPEDDRPRRAIELGRAWARGEISWAEARTAAGGRRLIEVEDGRSRRLGAGAELRSALSRTSTLWEDRAWRRRCAIPELTATAIAREVGGSKLARPGG